MCALALLAPQRFAAVPVVGTVLRATAWAVLALCQLAGAQTLADQADEATLPLKPSTLLQDKLPSAVRSQLPIFLRADSLTGRPDLDATLEGAAELRRGDMVIRADHMEYYQPSDTARARGHVRINRAGNVYEGPALELKVEAFEGFFTSPTYRLLKNDGHGQAERVDFLGGNRSVVHRGNFTTCQRDGTPGWMPDWVLQASTLRLDLDEETGQADSAVLMFKGLPLIPFPSISFPLSDKRKSGWLPPTTGLDNLSGLELTLPYYWDIAPNRDATFFPTVMTRRGVELGGEFRYLEPSYSGQARLNWMPHDKLRSMSRWGAAVTHSGGLNTGWPLGLVGLSLNLNRVSDDNYWRDFARSSPSLTQRLLANDAATYWAVGPVSGSVRALKWQVLQDVSSPITPPYDRLPQLTARQGGELPGGLDYSVEADYTRFRATPALTGQVNGERSFVVAQVSRPWLAPGWFITPRLQLHSTRYEFEGLLANGARTALRSVPTLSLDSGLVLERDARYFGRDFRQTLEPRAFYVYTPYRDQSLLPNYDSAANDFNFATMYTENAFGGHDRIADNNLLTLGVTSRLLDPTTGAEAVRLGVAQRLRFKDQRVTLPGQTPVNDRLSDLMLGAAIHWTPAWSTDSTVQFNPKTRRSIRTTLGGRYSPGNYRVISAAYRLQRDLSEQLDVGWQWPLNDLWGDYGTDLGPGKGLGGGRWYSVGRMNYSLQDRKLVDSVIGLEYDGCCWLGRVVLERLQRSGTSTHQRLLFQLEFTGFSRVGSNPLKTLRQNVPRYQYLREETTTPSRFSNYD